MLITRAEPVAWDRTRYREGPGRDQAHPLYLFPSTFHISSTGDVLGDVTYDGDPATTGAEAPFAHYSSSKQTVLVTILCC